MTIKTNNIYMKFNKLINFKIKKFLFQNLFFFFQSEIQLILNKLVVLSASISSFQAYHFLYSYDKILKENFELMISTQYWRNILSRITDDEHKNDLDLGIF